MYGTFSAYMVNCKSPCDECMLHVKYGAVQSGSSRTGLKFDLVEPKQTEIFDLLHTQTL